MNRISITIPDGILEPFQDLCEEQHRSVSGQVSLLMKRHILQDGSSHHQAIAEETENLLAALEELFYSDWEYTIRRLRDGQDYSDFLGYHNIWRWHRRDELARAYTELKRLIY